MTDNAGEVSLVPLHLLVLDMPGWGARQEPAIPCQTYHIEDLQSIADAVGKEHIVQPQVIMHKDQIVPAKLLRNELIVDLGQA